jgi:hypothetical protein
MNTKLLEETEMKKIYLLLVIGFLGVGVSGCVVYDDGYYYDTTPAVDLSFWNGGGAAWYGGGWYGGGSGWGGHHRGGGHRGHH